MSSKAVTEEAQDATESETLDATEDRLESVKIEEERQPNSHIELTVTIPARRCAKAWQRALRQAGNKLNLPGFRKGKKVRANLISKRYTLHANSIMASLISFPGKYQCPVHSRAIMFERCVYHEGYSWPNTLACVQIPEEMLFEHVSKRTVIQEAVQTLLRDSFPLVRLLAQ